MQKPLVLIILDGFGLAEASPHNAITQARTPHWDKLWNHNPHTTLSPFGTDVGLEANQMGNSEVGHLNMGAGRIVYQDSMRITRDIESGAFANNPELLSVLDAAKSSSLHTFSLLSEGGVHSFEAHLLALLRLAKEKGVTEIWVHAFLDGRDTPPQSAEASLIRLTALCEEIKVAKIATITGRYYAMDRDKRWDRIQKAYDAIVSAKADFHSATALEALRAAYARGEHDEFVLPTVIGNYSGLKKGTGLFMNFRADRARQLTRALVAPDFADFTRSAVPHFSAFATLTHYYPDQPVPALFSKASYPNVLGEYLQNAGLTQLRLAETEKYAHVTFFFNGGCEAPFKGESRILIPSPSVATYDLQPEMSAAAVTEALITAIAQKSHDVIICNFANADMVGHTGNLPAAIAAIECLDTALGKIEAAVLTAGAEALITADHGNAEIMFDAHTQQPHTAHTMQYVPLLYVGARQVAFRQTPGILASVAPTMLTLLGLPIPKEMTAPSMVLTVA